MRIKKLHLKDYKRFYDLTIDLGDDPKRIVALVGPNGCGKSSVFDAMLYRANVHMQIGDTGSKDYLYHSLSAKTNYDFQNIEITFTEDPFREIWDRKREKGTQNTIFSFRSSFRYNADLSVREARAVSDLRLNNFGATTASALDMKMEENYRRLNIKYNKYLNDNDCKPSEAKKTIVGELNQSINNCLDLEVDNLGSIEDSRGTLFFKKEDCSKPFEYNVLSAGEKEVVDILLDLYLRKDIYDDTVFIIDEPELHLNTKIQRKLFDEINNLVGEDCQIWVATHSIGFLRALQDEFRDESQIIEFKPDNKWASEPYTLIPIKANRDNWKSIFSTALDDLTNLISPKKIIYCEGRDVPGRGGMERGFDAKVFNSIFSEKYPDVLFISSGGNTELDQRSEIAIALLSKAIKDIEILVLKDRDMASGKPTDEKDRQVYLDSNPSNHRVLNRWEIENYLFDKEVLARYCEDKKLIFLEAEYDSFVTDIINQNLKDNIGHFKNFCSNKGSISEEAFKLNLACYVKEDMEIYKEMEQVIFKDS